MICKLKLALVIVIIHSRLHDLKAATIFDRYKTTNDNDNSSRNNNSNNNKISKNNHITFIDKINEVYNNNNQIFDNTTSSSLKPTTTTITKTKNITPNRQINIQHSFVDDAYNNTTLTKQLCNNHVEDKINSSCVSNNKIVNSNKNQSDAFKLDKDNNNAEFVNASMQLIFNDQDASNATTKIIKIQNLKILATSEVVNTSDATSNAEAADRYYKYNLTQNETKESMQSTEDTAEITEWEKEQLINIWEDILSVLDLEDFMRKYSSEKNNKCLMNGLKGMIQWWAYNNGTLKKEAFEHKNKKSSSNVDGYLDFSYNNVTNDEMLFLKTLVTHTRYYRTITVFSAAYNNLTQIPFRTLSTMKETLKCLTLKGNYFLAFHKARRLPDDIPNAHHANIIRNYRTSNTSLGETLGSLNNMTSNIEISDDVKRFTYQQIKKRINEGILYRAEAGIAWATFPKMPQLLELDISDCNIEFVERDIFLNITGLRNLYMSHNKMFTILHDTFDLLTDLEYLDLSYTNLFKFEIQPIHPTFDAVWHLIGGVKIQATTFKNLTKLVYLDLSHTKMTRNSAIAFTHLGASLKFMSLCFTFFPIVGNALFKHTGLVGLDLSGNPYLAHNIIEDPFEGIADSLKYLFFEESNLKDLDWLKQLENLHFLSLRGNYIYALSPHVFGKLRHLQLLDLSYNIIGNWYTQILKNNTELRILNLRRNNLNMINSEMLEDFKTLDYLSLANNNFLCDCVLRELMEVATINNKKAKCLNNLFADMPNVIMQMELPTNDVSPKLKSFDATEFDPLIKSLSLKRYAKPLEESFENLHSSQINSKIPRMRYVARNGLSILRSTLQDKYECNKINQTNGGGKTLNGTTLKFQLMDYEDECYWCFNGTNRMDFVQLNCDLNPLNIITTENINKLTQIVIISVCSIMSMTLLLVIVYLKRWHIYYYYSSLKSAALLSVATKEQVKKFNELAENDPNMVYDIFISYCQSDREWVLEELLPNVEEAENISICLHERDFQIGVAILENIISCMDRSRALMLIISSNFLLSHWCQFEMHLAQHRIFEVSKDHLIIVFLEDIPRNKRPKALQYLMEVKTYIKWPGAKGHEVTAEERKSFWKRMRNSLERIGITPAETHV